MRLEVKDKELRAKDSQAQQKEQESQRKLEAKGKELGKSQRELGESQRKLSVAEQVNGNKDRQLQEKDQEFARLLGGKEEELALLRAQLHDDDVVVRARSDQRLVQLVERVMREQMQRVQSRVEGEMKARLDEGPPCLSLIIIFSLSLSVLI